MLENIFVLIIVRFTANNWRTAARVVLYVHLNIDGNITFEGLNCCSKCWLQSGTIAFQMNYITYERIANSCCGRRRLLQQM